MKTGVMCICFLFKICILGDRNLKIEFDDYEFFNVDRILVWKYWICEFLFVFKFRY